MRIKMKDIEGKKLSKFYGLAYVDLNRMEVVMYPIPFNIIIVFFRKICQKIVYPKDVVMDAYWRGFNDGVKYLSEILERLNNKV